MVTKESERARAKKNYIRFKDKVQARAKKRY